MNISFSASTLLYIVSVRRALSSSYFIQSKSVITVPAMTIGKAGDGLGPADVEKIESHRERDDLEKPDSDAYEPQVVGRQHKTKQEKALLRKSDMCIVPLA